MGWQQLWEQVTGPLFALCLGVGYLAGKILVRHVIHSLADYEYDVWAMTAFLGVDLAVLSWSVAIGAEIDSRLAFTRSQTVMFFLLLTFSTALASASYGYFIKRRKRKRVAAIRDLQLSLWLSGSWFFGLLQFVPIVKALVSIRTQ